MSFKEEARRARERVARVRSHVVSTAWGAVEFIDQGQGVPILVSHGVLGGHDSLRRVVDLWVGDEYRAIGPSRFGYHGSTLPHAASPAAQADAYSALLDELALDCVVCFGISAGAPAAIQFALRHPDRVHGLILGSAYLPGMAGEMPSVLHPVMRAVAGWERGWWLLKTLRPTLLARMMGVPKGWDASTDADFLAIRDTLFPVQPKQHGFVFDVLVSEPASNTFALEEIAVPTLLVHAADDRLAPYRLAPLAAARIPHSRLVTIPRGGHLFLDHASEVRAATSGFISEVVSVARLKASASPTDQLDSSVPHQPSQEEAADDTSQQQG